MTPVQDPGSLAARLPTDGGTDLLAGQALAPQGAVPPPPDGIPGPGVPAGAEHIAGRSPGNRGGHPVRRSLPRAVGRGLIVGLALPLAAWMGGFMVFVWASLTPASEPPVSDGIVVLTGGADRIETALRLLAAGGGRVLLVSGVACGAELPELARRSGVEPGPLAARVTLGRQARTTLGNAAETAAWARAAGLRSLTVVTASYHMARALAEIGRALPDVVLRPDPVVPPALRGMESAGTLRMMGGEYTKWLAVRAGLSRLLPARLLPARALGRNCARSTNGPGEAGPGNHRAALRPASFLSAGPG